MINLLPQEEKQRLLLEKEKKLAIVWGIIVLVSLVCLFLLLLSIKFYIQGETDSQRNILLQVERENKISDFATVNASIQKYNETLAQLGSFYKKEIYFGQVLNIITSVPSPDGLFITDFSLKRNDGGTVKVNVSGVSDTREKLLVFKENILNDKRIIKPYFSPESWISPENADFNLTFEIHQNEK